MLSLYLSDVDCSFFLVTVDLWSGDGKQETNLVLHPSSTDRYVPTQPKPRRRGTSTSTPHNAGHQTPSRSTPAPSQFSGRGRDSQVITSLVSKLDGIDGRRLVGD